MFFFFILNLPNLLGETFYNILQTISWLMKHVFKFDQFCNETNIVKC